MFPIIDAFLGTAGKILDKFIPDANVREQAKQELAVLGLEMAKLETADRDSARRREMAVKDQTPSQLAWAYTAGYFAVLGVVIFHGVPDAQRDLVNVLIGVLSAAQVSIMGYYYGGSFGGDKVSAIVTRNGNGKG